MESSLPVIEYYEGRGKVRRIDADRPVEDVYRDVVVLFEPLVAKVPAAAH
jgi:UMP-CMP kinase